METNTLWAAILRGCARAFATLAARGSRQQAAFRIAAAGRLSCVERCARRQAVEEASIAIARAGWGYRRPISRRGRFIEVYPLSKALPKDLVAAFAVCRGRSGEAAGGNMRITAKLSATDYAGRSLSDGIAPAVVEAMADTKEAAEYFSVTPRDDPAADQ